MKDLTKKEIKKLQTNLSLIRKLAGWSTAELGDRIGVTKQTIGNLENGKSEMTKTQYIAIRAVIDYEIGNNEDTEALSKVVSVLLDSENLSDEDQEKIEDTMAFVSGAADRGLDKQKLISGMTTLLAGVGIAASIIGAATSTKAGLYPWMKKIIK